MKNKKNIIIIAIILLVLIIGIIVIPKSKKENKKTFIDSNGELREELITIKNDEDHKLEKNNIVIQEIKISEGGNSILIDITLLNNSDEDMNGFFAQLEFLDKNDNVLFITAKNYSEKFPSKKTIKIENVVSSNEKNKKVSNVRIARLEKDIASKMDDTFNQMGK